MDMSHSVTQNNQSIDHGVFAMSGPDQNQFGPDFANGSMDGDPLYHYSAQQESHEQDPSAMQYYDPYGAPIGDAKAQQWQRGRGPNDSLMSNQQQSLMTS